MLPPEVMEWIATWPLWLKVDAAIVGSLTAIYLLFRWLARLEKSRIEKDFRMDDAWRKWRMSQGVDPTYDEYGRLRK